MNLSDQIVSIEQLWKKIEDAPKTKNLFTGDVFEYKKRISSFGWDTIVVDHMMGTHANGNKSIHTYTYNQNVKRTSYLYETWDGSQLVPFWLCTYTYDLMGNRSIELQKRWEGNQWVNSLLKTFIYDSNGNMISELYETWDGSQWISAELYNYTYNFNGPDSRANTARVFPVVKVAAQGKEREPKTKRTIGTRRTINKMLRGRAKKTA